MSFFPLTFLAGLISTYVIVKGRPDKTEVNAERKLGILLLAAAIILLVGEVILMLDAFFSMYVFLAFLIAPILLFWPIKYALEKKSKLSLFAIVIVMLAISVILALIAWLGIFDPI